VYLSAVPAHSTLPYLRREADTLMQSAGYTLDWRNSTADRAPDSPNVIVVQLAGDCSAPSSPSAASTPVSSGRSLASATVQDGAVLPFARIDCSAVRGVLDQFAAREAPARRAYLYGRALGRLIAHEMYHILAQTRDHAASGIGKPCFTAADLLSERFEFEAVALERLHRAVVDPADNSFDIGRP